MGDLHYFHGTEALSMPQGLLLTHHRYIWDLLTCTKLDGAKEVIIQLSTPTSFTLHDSLPISCTGQQAGKRDDRTSILHILSTLVVKLSLGALASKSLLFNLPWRLNIMSLLA
ncbi:hypothetical protein AAG906_003358 [Vitis piasezkii]|uniref:Uncharacterized protein n=1 Tax=Vitis vinifera TaxID=29760 RepID=A0A438J0R6_VITVI|nr:hypothetical protein CK203_031077 [Vitis vinifera]